MVGYTKMVGALPRRWALPITQGLMAAAMLGFWFLFRTGAGWVSVAFYVWGALLGILLISQFWTLANGIYDPRQAKRLFGFIGGGVMLGGHGRPGLTALIIPRVGTNALLLLSAGALIAVPGRRRDRPRPGTGRRQRRRRRRRGARRQRWPRRVALLRESRQIPDHRPRHQLRVAWRGLIDQQVNMATEIFKGAGQEDAIGAFLAQIRFYTLIGGVRHPGLDHAAHPSLPGHRVRAVDAADQPRHHRDRSSSSTTRCGRRGSHASSITRSDTPSTRRRAKCCSCRCRASCARK